MYCVYTYTYSLSTCHTVRRKSVLAFYCILLCIVSCVLPCSRWDSDSKSFFYANMLTGESNWTKPVLYLSTEPPLLSMDSSSNIDSHAYTGFSGAHRSPRHDPLLNRITWAKYETTHSHKEGFNTVTSNFSKHEVKLKSQRDQSIAKI